MTWANVELMSRYLPPKPALKNSVEPKFGFLANHTVNGVQPKPASPPVLNGVRPQPLFIRPGSPAWKALQEFLRSGGGTPAVVNGVKPKLLNPAVVNGVHPKPRPRALNDDVGPKLFNPPVVNGVRPKSFPSAVNGVRPKSLG